jgi:predicted RNase H-like HicB family nuclease
MKSAFTAVIQRDGKWWIGWIEEVPGANAQAGTRKELLVNLKSALRDAIKLYRKEALAAVKGRFEEEILEV